MYTSDTPFARIMKLQEALYKVQGRIATVANALRQADEAKKRMEMDKQKLEIMRLRAAGEIEVDVEDEAVHEQGGCELAGAD